MPSAKQVERRASESRLKGKIGSMSWPGKWQMRGKKASLWTTLLLEVCVMGSDQEMGRDEALRKKPFSCDTIIDKSHKMDEL